MIDHISITVSDLKRSRDFYQPLLELLDMKIIADRPKTVGFGKKYPEFWLNHRPDMNPTPADTGFHICLRAKTTETIDRFHEIALANGGTCGGEPGKRQAAMGVYYAAFIHDPDGNKIELMTVPRD